MINRILVLLALLSATAARGQGCSDAGVCTMGTLRHDPETATDSRHKISLSTAIGRGDDNVSVLTPALQYSFMPSKSIELQARISANRACGSLGCASGAGDILLDVVKTIRTSGKAGLSVVGGIKIPLNNSNLTVDGKSLPMQYQSSLGTLDAIVGATVSYRKWLFSLGYQQPLSGANNNQFVPALWSPAAVSAYPQSYKLRRRADVVAKTACNVVARNRWKIAPGLLVVYHTGEDQYVNSYTLQEDYIKGSDGVTVNLTLNVSYSTPRWTFSLLGGSPLAVRDVRPDGLTRSLALLPEISFKF